MAFETFRVNNNEAVGDFTHVTRLPFSELNTLAIDGVSAEIASVPKGGGVELCGVITSEQLVTSADDHEMAVGTTVSDPQEFFLQQSMDAATDYALYNTGADFVQIAGTTTIEGGSLPVGIAVSADVPVYILFEGSGDLTAGELLILMRITNPLRFAAVAV